MADQTAGKHVSGQYRLQFTISDENHGAKILRAELEMLSQALGVAEILPQRILELKFFSEVGYSPLRGVFVAENPSGVVFRFDDEDTVTGHQHVIDLRGAVAARHNDVVKAAIDGVVQLMPQSKLGDLFAKPAFEQ